MEKLEIKKTEDLVLKLNEYKRKLSRIETNLEIATAFHSKSKDKRKWNKKLKEITAYKRHYEKIILQIRRALETEDPRPGRPILWDETDTLQWYIDLAKRPEYQKKNGTPHKKNIIYKIMELHEEITGHEPSFDTIENHLKGKIKKVVK